MSKTETPDIVSLLRERGEWKDGGKVWEQDALCAVAAAEIERLRSELAKQGETWRKTLHVERECSLNETRLKDQFRSRALATEAELAKHQWRTMDDAPRDGTLVIVWCPASEDAFDIAYAALDFYEPAIAEWRRSRPDQQPTHWMPLPPPPPSPPGENDGR